MFNGPVVPFADIMQQKNAGGNRRGISWLGALGLVLWSGDGESYSIPNARRRRPVTAAGVSQIAECFQDLLRRNLVFVAGGRAVTAPSASKRKPGRMRPFAIFHSRHRHEVRASQIRSPHAQQFVGTGNCNQSEERLASSHLDVPCAMVRRL